jgi:hypothetical protein
MEHQKGTDDQPLFETTRGGTTVTFLCLAAGGYRILSNGTVVGTWEAARLASCMRTYMYLAGTPAPAGRMPVMARGRSARQGNARLRRGSARTERGQKPVAVTGR